MNVKAASKKKLNTRTAQHYSDGEIYDRKEAGEKCQQYYYNTDTWTHRAIK